MKSRKLIFQAFLVLSAAILSICAGAQGGIAGGDSSSAARKLISQGQYAEALALTEPGLKADPANADLRMCQVDALLGLHRTLEARTLALSSASMGPGFRFKVGVATLKFGQVMAAVDIWKPLYADKDWAAQAYAESVKALLAGGKEAEAKALLLEAMQKVQPPAVSLLLLSLHLDVAKEAWRATLDQLKAGDPVNASKYEALAKVYGAADGSLCQESFEGKLPVEVSLKEKSERLETSSHSWGGAPGSTGGGLGGGAGAATHSGTQSYGSGPRNTSNSEGGKTGTVQAPPRVVVEARINGEKSAPMVLDSASDVVLIAPQMAKKLNLQRVAPGDYDGVGLPAGVPSNWVLLKEIVVGPLRFKNVPALLIDDKTEYWKETGGVIPLWMFRHYGLHYDRRHSKLTLYPSGTSPEQVLGAGATRLNVLWMGGRPYAETRIQDKPSCFMLVSSSNMGTYIEARRSADLGLSLQTSKYGPQRERGLFGLFSSGVSDKVALNLGPTRINLPTVLVADLCPDGEVDCTGMLGRNILDLFDMYFDYSAGTFAIKGYEKGR